MTELERQLAYLQSPKENLNQVGRLKKKLEMARLAERVLGRRVCCDYTRENKAVTPLQGMCGVVTHVDDADQIRVQWDNGSTSVLNSQVDRFTVLD